MQSDGCLNCFQIENLLDQDEADQNALLDLNNAHARETSLLSGDQWKALIDKAKQAGLKRIVCEVNLSPPNPKSDAFHQRMGFVEVGQAVLEDRNKTVRYLCKLL